jgi:hypothetical protein
MHAGNPQIFTGIRSSLKRKNRLMYTKWYSKDKEFALPEMLHGGG